ncbi:MAG: UDP-N-acetylmuramate:L-alanyl-gamma-D-glutamyl-meso-diaminopimelate ligase [Myxococcales bacterium]|nr:UDP-N-acetylmuramate:L-alanyl-gamma-D-glutamyl-meso-diaminopimelate ligase [Myxococcales bacterium]
MASSLDIHLIGICGTGMGSFAGLLKASGHRVRGSDHNVYPPMSDKLTAWNIPVMQGYHPNNLLPHPDLVVIGNVVRRTNPEAVAVLEKGLKYASFPETLGELFLKERRSLVVAGTHGKTTTSSLLAWLLTHAGKDPGMLIGGIPQNFGEGFRMGSGPAFVVEGDEYDTAFFDKRPKFLSYCPQLAILTSLEYDHADIYPDLESIEMRFDQLTTLVPKTGYILACASSEPVLRRKSRAEAKWETYSAKPGIEADWQVSHVLPHTDGVRFTILHQGTSMGDVNLPMSGRYNVENALAATAAAIHEGLSFDEAREGLASFNGVARRQTVVAEINEIRIIDDFAHHPTAVASTLDGIRERYGANGRILAVFEPRSATSSRKYFQSAYANAFGAADYALIAPVGRSELSIEERLDTTQLAEHIQALGTQARAFTDLDALVQAIAILARPRDTIVFMSNGGFDEIHKKTQERLAQRPKDR